MYETISDSATKQSTMRLLIITYSEIKMIIYSYESIQEYLCGSKVRTSSEMKISYSDISDVYHNAAIIHNVTINLLIL